MIIVSEKNLTLIKPATPNEMVLETEFFFTDPTFDPTVPVKPG